MDRRSFLKLSGLVAITGAFHQRHTVPLIYRSGVTAIQPWPHKEDGFCEFCEYGNLIPYTGNWKQSGEFILKMLHKGAKKVLPPGTYYEIRLRMPSWPAFDERGRLTS